MAHTDTSSPDTKITAATQINHTDTSSADTNITAAPQINHTDTSSPDTDITAAPQITHTDTSSADTNITAAKQITHTHTPSANANITAATNSQLDTLSGSLQTHSPLWRALRRSRGRLRTVANGCGHRHNFPPTQPHPHTPKWNGNPRYAFGKKKQQTSPTTRAAGSILQHGPVELHRGRLRALVVQNAEARAHPDGADGDALAAERNLRKHALRWLKNWTFGRLLGGKLDKPWEHGELRWIKPFSLILEATVQSWRYSWQVMQQCNICSF